MDISKFTEQTKKIADLRILEAEKASDKKKVTEELEIAEKEMISMLTEANLPSFKSEYGNVFISHRLSVKTPKTPEDRAVFFNYLRLEGVFDSMITVNSATLNSFYKAQIEEAKARGEDDFEIPGLTEVTVEQNLAFRRS